MKSTPESAGYKLWPSCDVILKCRTVTSVHTGVCVDLPSGYVGIIYNKMGLTQDGIVIVSNILDTNSHGALRLLMHNTTGTDYKVLKENPLAQMIIYHVADLPVHHDVLHSTFSKENYKISIPIDIPEESPNVIPPTPRKAKPPVPPKPSWLCSLNATRVLFRNTDESTSDSDGVLFQESPTSSSPGKCSDHNRGFSDFKPDIHQMNVAAGTSMRRVTHSLS